MTDSDQISLVNTTNEFLLGLTGGDHPMVAPHSHPTYRTKQEAYRYAAWLLFMADCLPDEPSKHTFEEVSQAILNT